MDICSNQRSPVLLVEMHGIPNRDVHLYQPHNSSLMATTYARRTEWITDRMLSGWRTLGDFVFASPTSAPTLLEWPCQETACVRQNLLRTGVGHFLSCLHKWSILRLVSVSQKNRQMTMLSSTDQSIDLPKELMAWRFWMTITVLPTLFTTNIPILV